MEVVSCNFWQRRRVVNVGHTYIHTTHLHMIILIICLEMSFFFVNKAIVLVVSNEYVESL